MSCHSSPRLQHQAGLSLLELLVAFAIMAIALGMLYRAAGASVRDVGETESYQRAVFLAQSLLAARDAIPPEGISEAGRSAGFDWAMRSQPYANAAASPDRPAAVPLLHAVEMSVAWTERGMQRRIQLQTLRPQRQLPPGAGGGR